MCHGGVRFKILCVGLIEAAAEQNSATNSPSLKNKHLDANLNILIGFKVPAKQEECFQRLYSSHI
jgi:hypothetical protein